MSEQLCKEHQAKIQEVEIKLAKMDATLDHIKDRIDNGMSKTITKVYDKLMEIAPKVDDNCDIVGRVKAFAFWITVIGIGGGLVSFSFHLLRNIGT